MEGSVLCTTDQNGLYWHEGEDESKCRHNPEEEEEVVKDCRTSAATMPESEWYLSQHPKQAAWNGGAETGE